MKNAEIKALIESIYAAKHTKGMTLDLTQRRNGYDVKVSHDRPSYFMPYSVVVHNGDGTTTNRTETQEFKDHYSECCTVYGVAGKAAIAAKVTELVDHVRKIRG